LALVKLDAGYVIVFQKDIALWILLSSDKKILTDVIQKDGDWIIERGILQDWM
jgi:hypothetical protein